ncbi:hypothetical protein CgunFtcFv8_014924 [Champsocephalus gunnari]|uniref:Uncharacterized protein n=1 Tax=Champsocephalus gunnari TaxID=52237 RepID=A0AAN8E9D1_CHAGU|nr:hypothetical protein CgunFtcFv8_014924 [Champsocephalus gunnari]
MSLRLNSCINHLPQDDDVFICRPALPRSSSLFLPLPLSLFLPLPPSSSLFLPLPPSSSLSVLRISTQPHSSRCCFLRQARLSSQGLFNCLLFCLARISPSSCTKAAVRMHLTGCWKRVFF